MYNLFILVARRSYSSRTSLFYKFSGVLVIRSFCWSIYRQSGVCGICQTCIVLSLVFVLCRAIIAWSLCVEFCVLSLVCGLLEFHSTLPIICNVFSIFLISIMSRLCVGCGCGCFSFHLHLMEWEMLWLLFLSIPKFLRLESEFIYSSPLTSSL